MEQNHWNRFTLLKSVSPARLAFYCHIATLNFLLEREIISSPWQLVTHVEAANSKKKKFLLITEFSPSSRARKPLQTSARFIFSARLGVGVNQERQFLPLPCFLTLNVPAFYNLLYMR